MTGLDRLRGYARRMDELHVWPGGAKLLDIAEQIERELEDERCSDIETVRSDAMEAWRWVREHGGLDHVRVEWSIRSNLKRMYEKKKAKVERQQRHIEFVQGKCRERQGRIVAFRKELAELRKVLSDYRDALGGMCERLGLTDGMSLPEMPEVICEALDRRLMPEGMEWPRYEDGEPVKLGDWAVANSGEKKGEAFRVNRIWFEQGTAHMSGTLKDGHYWHWKRKDPCVRRPAVFSSDGEPLEVGQTVWDERGDELQVLSIENDYECHVTCHYEGIDGIKANGWWLPRELTHQRPVLDADGVPIREGDTVWTIYTGDGFVAKRVAPGNGEMCVFVADDEHRTGFWIDPASLTHAKPEPPDSWERIEEDADALVDAEINGEGSYNAANAYCNRRGLGEGTSFVLMAQDLVRRCRALAERERGE